MKSSDIRIVSYCIDYMQLLDLQGELHQQRSRPCGRYPPSSRQKLMSPMGSYNDSLLCQSIPPEKNELYDDFIRHVLQAYQAYKQMFTPYAPDVQAGNIKSSPHLHRPSRLVVSVSEDPNVTSSLRAPTPRSSPECCPPSRPCITVVPSAIGGPRKRCRW